MALAVAVSGRGLPRRVPRAFAAARPELTKRVPGTHKRTKLERTGAEPKLDGHLGCWTGLRRAERGIGKQVFSAHSGSTADRGTKPRPTL